MVLFLCREEELVYRIFDGTFDGTRGCLHDCMVMVLVNISSNEALFIAVKWLLRVARKLIEFFHTKLCKTSFREEDSQQLYSWLTSSHSLSRDKVLVQVYPQR